MQVLSETEGARRIAGPAGPLEARIESPRGTDRGADLVVCHPHPLHGGTMDNKVVHTLARAARDAGFRAVRFNFRGVGGSAGRHDEGRGEVDDLLAIVEATAAQGRTLTLAGFSFGAWVAAQGAARLVAVRQPPAGLLLVAPPVHYAGFDGLGELPSPCRVIQGLDDDIVEAAAVRAWCAGRRPVPALVELPAGHFFHGALPELKAATEAFLAGLPGLDAPPTGG